MSISGLLRTAFVFTILLLLHYTLRPLLGWRAEIDFLTIAVLLVAVRVRPGVATLIGFAVGLAWDSMFPQSFGAAALGMSAIAFAASWLKAVFFADNLALSALFLFAGKWVFDLVYVLSDRLAHTPQQLVVQLLMWSPLSAAVTALAGVLVLVLFRPVLGRTTAS